MIEVTRACFKHALNKIKYDKGLFRNKDLAEKSR